VSKIILNNFFWAFLQRDALFVFYPTPNLCIYITEFNNCLKYFFCPLQKHTKGFVPFFFKQKIEVVPRRNKFRKFSYIGNYKNNKRG